MRLLKIFAFSKILPLFTSNLGVEVLPFFKMGLTGQSSTISIKHPVEARHSVPSIFLLRCPTFSEVSK